MPEGICGCVSDHRPICRSFHTHHIMPIGMGGPDEDWNLIKLCPNQHAMTHRLIRLWGYRYNTTPPWWIRRHFSPIAREMAETGWHAWNDAGRPVDRDNWKWQGEPVAVDLRTAHHLDMLGLVTPNTAESLHANAARTQ